MAFHISTMMCLQWHLLAVTLFSCPEGVTVSGEDCSRWNNMESKFKHNFKCLFNDLGLTGRDGSLLQSKFTSRFGFGIERRASGPKKRFTARRRIFIDRGDINRYQDPLWWAFFSITFFVHEMALHDIIFHPFYQNQHNAAPYSCDEKL